MSYRSMMVAGALLSLTGATGPALGSTGICDSNAPVSTQACIDAIQANGAVHNEIFTDSNGLTGLELPVFGKLFNAWPGCDLVDFAGCAGESLTPFDCPGQ